MATINAKDVAALRAKTGIGMMECKKALVEAEGDMEKAMKVLRERGLAVAAKKEGRIAAEGVVDILKEGNVAAMIEVNAETDFVAKNEKFLDFVKGLLKTIIATKPADVAELLTKNFDGTEMSVEAKLKDMIFTIGENMNIRRFLVVEGVLTSYIHGKGSTGVIVKFEADDAVASNEGFAAFAKNIALQVAAMPVKYLNKESVPAEVLEEEKAILVSQMKNDPKMANKPDAVLVKIVEGKLGKYYENNCLLEQAYVKDDSMSVGKYVASVAKDNGGSITVTGFTRFDKGEGIEKREEDYAAEIAKMVKG